MTKTYCDKCGREVENYSDIYLPFRKKSKKRPYVITKSYDLCDECIKLGHREFNNCSICNGASRKRIIFFAIDHWDNIYSHKWYL